MVSHAGYGGVRWVLLDIEGTTTDIHFVHDVLFPYATDRLADFVASHADHIEVRRCLAEVKATVLAETGQVIDDPQTVLTLLQWIRDDRKHGALKHLQGLIWQTGYETGAYQGHLYPDVLPAFQAWQAQGVGLAIYSSGSVQAQELLFRYSTAGDLTPYLRHYFDTQVGGKKDPASYEKILAELKQAPDAVLFLSDQPDELIAAQSVGLQVGQLKRPSAAVSPWQQSPNVPCVPPWPCFETFEAINILR